MAEAKWSVIIEELQHFRIEFEKSYKCLNKSQKPSPTTINKHLEILQLYYNKTITLINNIKDKLTDDHISECEILVDTLQDKISKISEELKLSFTFPPYYKEINLPTLDLNDITCRESNMADQIKFLEVASKILPDFDGNFINLRKFIDAINLLVAIKGENPESLLISIINTKITSNIRNKIEGLNTIVSIIERLKSVIKGYSADTLMTKLNTIKQHDKNQTQYIKEIEQLSNELANVYMSNGMTEVAANKIATNAATKSLIQNTSSERVKLILQAGTFNSIEEVTSKFLEIDTHSNNSIMFVKHRNRAPHNFNHNRSFNRNNFQNYNNNRSNNIYNNRNNRHNNNYRNNNNGINYRNNNNPNNTRINTRRTNFDRNVHFINSREQGNEEAPLTTQLGEN